MSDSIFIQLESDLYVLGKAPLRLSDKPDTKTFSFYVNDFFLTRQTPWIIPKESVVLNRSQLLAHLKEKHCSSQEITWSNVSTDSFQRMFAESINAFRETELEKIVPILFEHGKIPDTWANSIFETIAFRQVHAINTPYAYGLSLNNQGFCGVTPEVLFTATRRELKTFALAGTQDATRGTLSIENEKDHREHALVIDDIARQLSQLGSVSIETTIPHTVGSLVHLQTPISVKCIQPFEFTEIVSTLHPTAALGVYPRSDAGHALLRKWDDGVNRDIFGGPFGVLDPHGNGLCLVSIRCIQWENLHARIGSGCGVIHESDYASELQELKLKRDSVKARLRSSNQG